MPSTLITIIGKEKKKERWKAWPSANEKKQLLNSMLHYLEGACSPARYEPELSLNLEICEMINKKQGSA